MNSISHRNVLFNRPNVGTAKAIDQSKYILGNAQLQMGAFNSVGKAMTDAVKVAELQALSEEERIGQDIYNKYIVSRNEEDLVLHQKQRKEAVEYLQKDYYKNNKLYHAEAVNGLNSLPPAVAEKYRDMINQENISRHMRAQEYVFKQKEAWEDDTLAATQTLESQNAQRKMTRNNVTNNKKQLDVNFAHAAYLTREHFKNRGYDDVYINFQLQNLQSKFLTDAAEYLARDTGGLKDAVDLINSYEGQINNSDFLAISRHYEEQYLRLIYADAPGLLQGKNGQYDDNKGKQYARHLTEYERKSIAKNVTSESKTGNLSGEAQNLQAENEIKFVDMFYRNNAAFPTHEYPNLITEKGEVNYKELNKLIESGEITLSKAAKWYADGMSELLSRQKDSENNDLGYNKYTANFINDNRYRLDSVYDHVVKQVKTIGTEGEGWLTHYATNHDVVALLIHNNLDDTRKKKFLGFTIKRENNNYATEKDILTETHRAMVRRGIGAAKNFSFMSAADKSALAASMAEGFLRADPRFVSLWADRSASVGDEDKNPQIAAAFNQLKSDFLNVLNVNILDRRKSAIIVGGGGRGEILFMERQANQVMALPSFGELSPENILNKNARISNDMQQ